MRLGKLLDRFPRLPLIGSRSRLPALVGCQPALEGSNDPRDIAMSGPGPLSAAPGFAASSLGALHHLRDVTRLWTDVEHGRSHLKDVIDLTRMNDSHERFAH